MADKPIKDVNLAQPIEESVNPLMGSVLSKSGPQSPSAGFIKVLSAIKALHPTKLDPVMDQAMRTDPQQARSAQVGQFLGGLEAERESKKGESSGVGDLLTFLPAGTAAKAFASRRVGSGILDTVQFLEQFGDPGEEYMHAVVPRNIKRARQALMGEAVKQGRSGPRTPYHDFLDKQEQLHGNLRTAQPWQRRLRDAGVTDLVRVARDAKVPSDRRLGTFYNAQTPTTMSWDNHWLTRHNGSPTGGDVMYQGTLAPRNIYVRNDKTNDLPSTLKNQDAITDQDYRSSIDFVSRNLRGNSDMDEIYRISEIDQITPDVLRVLGKHGINNKEAAHIWSAEEGGWARRDAIAARIAQKQGYDSIGEITPGKRKYLEPNIYEPVNMKAPEILTFRQPRFNFSYDRKAFHPRGLSNVGLVEEISAVPKTPIDDKVRADYAAGRAASLGRTKPVSPASPNGTPSAPVELSPAQKTAQSIGMVAVGPNVGEKEGMTSFFGPNTLDPFTTVSESSPQILMPQNVTLGKYKQDLPGVFTTGVFHAGMPLTVSVIPGQSAKVYHQGMKVQPKFAEEALHTAKADIDYGTDYSQFEKKDVFKTILKSLGQIERVKPKK